MDTQKSPTDRRRPDTQFQGLVEHSFVGMAIAQDDRFLYVNPKYCEIFNYTRDELLQRVRVPDLAADADRALVMENMRTRLQGIASGVVYTFKGKRKDGTLIDVEMRGAVMVIDGRPALISSLMDVTDRKESEKALAASELRYRRLFEAARDGILIYDLSTGQIIDVNPFVVDLLGYSREEYLGKKVWELEPLMDMAATKAAFEQLQSTGYFRHGDMPLKSKDGRGVFVEVVSNAYLVANRRIVQCNIRDITERSQAEQARGQSEAALRQAQRLAQLGYYRWSKARQCLIGCNDEYLKILGRPVGGARTSVPGIQPYLHPDDRERFVREHRAAEAEGRGGQIEFRIVRPDGALRYLRDLNEPEPSPDGPPEIWFGTLQDITERKLANLALQRLTRTLRTLSRAKRELIRAADERALYLAMCQVIVETGGYRMAWIGLLENDPERPVRPVAEAGHVAGYLDTTRVTWADSELGRGPTGTAARTGLAQVNEDFATNTAVARWRAAALDRGYRSSIALPLVDSSNVFGVLTIYASEPGAFGPDELEQLTEFASDLCYSVRALRLAAVHEREIVERGMLERRLQQAQKMEAVGQLASGVAHDFNNLLTIISGFSDALLEKLPPNDPLTQLVTPISEAGERGASLTGQLLALGHRSILEPKTVDLNAIVADTEKMLRRVIGESILVVTSFDPSVSRVRVDPGQLQQVLLNLAINSRDAMPVGGRLTVETANVVLNEAYAAAHPDAAPGNYVMLSVTDTGVGMTSQVQARIFEPFFTTKETGKGTGLGLAMVHGIVKQSGGFIEVYSETGVGTTFKVYLPAVMGAIPEIASRGPTPERQLTGIETVLMVDDENDILRLGQLVLETHGYKVVVARDAAQGLRAAEAHRGTIDILITDVVMPGMGGRELAEALRARHAQMKVLFASGYPEDAIVRHGILRSEVAFLRKPYTAAGLLKKIREVLDARPG